MKKALAQTIFFTLALCVIFPQKAKAQDPQYSQFYSNLLMLNPAFAGSGTGPRVAMNYRAQWVRIPGYFRQFAFSYDQPFYLGRTTQGFGLYFNSDVAGEGNLTKLDVTLNYAFQAEISDDHILRFGISGGIQQASIDFFKLRFPDQIDPRDGVVRASLEPGLAGGLAQSVIRPDVNAGVAYFNEYAFVGLTVSHLTQPEQRFYTGQSAPGLPPDVDARLPRKYTVTGGIKLPVGPARDPDAITITPAFLYKTQGEFSQIDAGLYVDIEPMVFGVWYRNQDAMIGLIGIRQGPFSFGYSYDYTISDLTQGVSGGSHEVSVVLEFEQYRRGPRPKHKPVPCPRF